MRGHKIAQLRLAKESLMSTSNIFFIQMKQKAICLDFSFWCGPGNECQSDCIGLTLKHGGGSMLIWVCSNARGLEEVAFAK